MTFENTIAFAKSLDAKDPLVQYRERFLIPAGPDGKDSIYLASNSLGLQAKTVKKYIEHELDDWARLGVAGHFQARNPWSRYPDKLQVPMARLVGALPQEVVLMNTLSVNLHLMMVSFYRPTKTRFKILMESSAFPSDQYAVASQVEFHGFDPSEAIIELKPRSGERTLRHEDILQTIEQEGESVALILLGNVNYLTGQAFDMQAITKAGRANGCAVGFDLAHAVGNLELKLHDWAPDFAVWCNYKYLSGGPGTVGGCFVHERHLTDSSLPRFAGWWGHNKDTRFKMGPRFDPIPAAEGWALSTPLLFQLASVRAALEIFDEVGMSKLRTKSDLLTGYLEYLIKENLSDICTIVTPQDRKQRGAQLSLCVKATDPQSVLQRLLSSGVVCDFRQPDVIRAAPAPLINRFEEMKNFVTILREVLTH